MQHHADHTNEHHVTARRSHRRFVGRNRAVSSRDGQRYRIFTALIDFGSARHHHALGKAPLRFAADDVAFGGRRKRRLVRLKPEQRMR